MTVEVLAGRRVGWAKPVQVFLIANLVYYLIATKLQLSTFETPLKYQQLGSLHGDLAHSWSAAKATRLGLSDDEYAARFDALAHTLAKTLVLFFVPVLALAFGVMARRAHRYALEHVTVGTHFMSLVLLIIPLPYPLVWGLYQPGLTDQADTDAVWTLISALIIGFYAWWFMRRIYASSRVMAVLQAVGITFVFFRP